MFPNGPPQNGLLPAPGGMEHRRPRSKDAGGTYPEAFTFMMPDTLRRASQFSHVPQKKDVNTMRDYLESMQSPYCPSLDNFMRDAQTTYYPYTSLSPPSTISAVSSLSSLSTRSPTIQTCTSRGPSPLRNSAASVASGDSVTVASVSTVGADERENFICLGPQCDAAFPSERELAAHFKEKHTQTCNWTGCSGGSFSNREALIWHVKAEHLLVCPVGGCKEEFAAKKLLACHVEVVHPDKGQGQDGTKSPGKRKWKAEGDRVAEELRGRLKVRRTDDGERAKILEDKALKEVLSVTVSKKRCREQLKNVLEKRARKVANGTPRTADSPTSEARSSLLDSAPFPLVWEHGVLPFLIEFIPKWCGPGHVVSVTRRPGAAASSLSRSTPGRRINIMTRKPVSRARRVIIASHVRDLLPEQYRVSSSFCFATGEVSRLVWARGLGKDMPDEVCPPRNPFHFKNPCMGDSIGIPGIPGDEGMDEATATLGPCLLLGGGSFWLANLHPFIDAVQAGEDAGVIQHPSPSDRRTCYDDDHDALSTKKDGDFALGRLTAWSGFDLKTTRLSHEPYWDEMDKEPPMVVTDWTLISSSSRTANISRRFPQENNPLLKEPLVKTIGHVTPGAIVTVSSRTSGNQRGVVCEVPAYIDGANSANGTSSGNGTGTSTREWYIEELSGEDDDNEWIRGGVGVPGDSGAGVVDTESNALVGQLWGRNKYWGPGPRTAFFTPMSDVLDDIQERCRLQSRPSLPQYRDEADRYPVYPSCRQCYDLRAYLESRRSSRESLVSMIGGPRMGETDPDLTSIEGVSELATPKDQNYWLRHAGADDPNGNNSSFNNLSSPAPLSSFFGGGGHPGTPGIADSIRSPYAQMLDDVDLYDNFQVPPESPLGKCSAPAMSLLGSSSNEVRGSKKRRTV